MLCSASPCLEKPSSASLKWPKALPLFWTRLHFLRRLWPCDARPWADWSASLGECILRSLMVTVNKFAPSETACTETRILSASLKSPERIPSLRCSSQWISIDQIHTSSVVVSFSLLHGAAKVLRPLRELRLTHSEVGMSEVAFVKVATRCMVALAVFHLDWIVRGSSHCFYWEPQARPSPAKDQRKHCELHPVETLFSPLLPHGAPKNPYSFNHHQGLCPRPECAHVAAHRHRAKLNWSSFP